MQYAKNTRISCCIRFIHFSVCEPACFSGFSTTSLCTVKDMSHQQSSWESTDSWQLTGCVPHPIFFPFLLQVSHYGLWWMCTQSGIQPVYLQFCDFEADFCDNLGDYCPFICWENSLTSSDNVFTKPHLTLLGKFVVTYLTLGLSSRKVTFLDEVIPGKQHYKHLMLL